MADEVGYERLEVMVQNTLLRSVIEDVVRRASGIRADDDPTHYVTSEGRNFGQYTKTQAFDPLALVSQPEIDMTVALVERLKKQAAEVEKRTGERPA